VLIALIRPPVTSGLPVARPESFTKTPRLL
jgi:hypothetical protein